MMHCKIDEIDNLYTLKRCVDEAMKEYDNLIECISADEKTSILRDKALSKIKEKWKKVFESKFKK